MSAKRSAFGQFFRSVFWSVFLREKTREFGQFFYGKKLRNFPVLPHSENEILVCLQIFIILTFYFYELKNSVRYAQYDSPFDLKPNSLCVVFSLMFLLSVKNLLTQYFVLRPFIPLVLLITSHYENNFHQKWK